MNSVSRRYHRLAAVSPSLAGDAREHFFEVAQNGAANINGQRAFEECAPESRRHRRRHQRNVFQLGVAPRHMRSRNVRDSLSALRPAGVTETQRVALPPGAPVGSLIHDVTRPLSSSRGA